MLRIVRSHLQADSPALFRRDRPRRPEQRLAQPRRGREALNEARRGQDAVRPEERTCRVDQCPGSGAKQKRSGNRDPAAPVPENDSRKRSGEKKKRQLQPGAPGLPLEHQAEKKKTCRDEGEKAPEPPGAWKGPPHGENTHAGRAEQEMNRITRRIVEERGVNRLIGIGELRPLEPSRDVKLRSPPGGSRIVGREADRPMQGENRGLDTGVPRGKRRQKLQGDVSRDVGECENGRKGLVDGPVLSAEGRAEEREISRHVAGVDSEREKRREGEASDAAGPTADDGASGQKEAEGKGDRESGGFCQDSEPEAASRQEKSGQIHLSRPRAQREVGENEQPEGNDQVVLCARSLQDGHRERRCKNGRDALPEPVRPEIPGQKRRGDRHSDPRERLQEVDPAIGSAEKLDLRSQQLGARPECELPHHVSRIVGHARVLDPMRDSRQVIRHRVPGVGSRRARRQRYGNEEKRQTREKRNLLFRRPKERGGGLARRRPARSARLPPGARRDHGGQKQPRPDDDRTVEAPREARELGDRRREEAGQDRRRQESFPTARSLRRGISRFKKAGTQNHAKKRKQRRQRDTYRRYASGRRSSSAGNRARSFATLSGSTSAKSTRSRSSPSASVSPRGEIAAESPA